MVEVAVIAVGPVALLSPDLGIGHPLVDALYGPVPVPTTNSIWDTPISAFDEYQYGNISFISSTISNHNHESGINL